MPKFEGFLAELKFSTPQYKRLLDDQLETELYRCWEAWLDKFLEIVPVWTGESVGSILPLAQLIGRTVPITPSATAPGDRSGRGAGKSSATVSIGGGKATITYTTNVEHLIINEYIDARVFGFKLKKPGPYDFQGQALAAFMEAARTVTLPDPFLALDYKLVGFE